VERTEEALNTDADIISTACPYCITMLSDAVTAKIQSGDAREGIQVLDVSQILARSLKAPAAAVEEVSVAMSSPAPASPGPEEPTA
jgi:heterodisulfide reductase subunit B